MHEMGITDAMLKTVDRILAKEGMEGANRIVVQVGDLSGVVPRFLEDCWEAVAAGTKYQDTELVVETVPGTARCEDCKREFTVDIDDLRCPDCRSVKLTPLTGRDLTICQIEAY